MPIAVELFEKTDSDYLIEATDIDSYFSSLSSSHGKCWRFYSGRLLRGFRSGEREHTENAGGFVLWAGVLSVSRAFGNTQLKNCAIAVPEIQEDKIKGIKFFIIATGGIWNVVSDEETVSIVQRISDAEASARKLVEEASSKGSADSITCIVVRFQKTIRELTSKILNPTDIHCNLRNYPQFCKMIVWVAFTCHLHVLLI